MARSPLPAHAAARKPTPRPAEATRKPTSEPTRSRAIDVDLVRDIADLLAGSDLTEIEVEKGDLRVRVARAGAVIQAPAVSPVSVSVAAPPATVVSAAAAPPADNPGTVKSPMVGTAYRRPNPEAKAFVEVGSHVAAGERVMLVEAMKTFNEITAHRAGTVSAILVEDGQPVEYGQALLVID